mmetsp:Transcript_14796/g.20751  ORF Transcript_14796/g.20751 Transcript_14796/m.20751 type:complete len:275 (-) Transcript_14796:284-1108(-)
MSEMFDMVSAWPAGRPDSSMAFRSRREARIRRRLRRLDFEGTRRLLSRLLGTLGALSLRPASAVAVLCCQGTSSSSFVSLPSLPFSASPSSPRPSRPRSSAAWACAASDPELFWEKRRSRSCADSMVVRKSTGTKAAVSGGVASLSSPASELGAGGPASLCRVPLLAPGAVSVSSVVTAASVGETPRPWLSGSSLGGVAVEDASIASSRPSERPSAREGSGSAVVWVMESFSSICVCEACACIETSTSTWQPVSVVSFFRSRTARAACAWASMP